LSAVSDSRPLAAPEAPEATDSAARALLSLLSRRLHDCVLVLGPDDALTHVNDGARAMLSLGREEVTWSRLLEAVHSEDRARFLAACARCRSEGLEHRGIAVSLTTAGGRDIRVACDLLNLEREPGIGGVVLRLRDLDRPAPGRGGARDVGDRGAVVRRAEAELQRCRAEPDRRFALIVLTIDRWDEIASALGAPTAQAITEVISERIYRAASQHGFVGRVDRDRFAILVAPLGASDAVDSLAQEMQLRVQEAVTAGDVRELNLTASVGIALGPRRYATGEDALRAAETAFRSARRKGAGASAIFDTGMHQALVDRFWIEHDLRRAVIAREFSLNFQPIVRLDDERLSSFEALVRWDHRTRGPISPEDFIPVAEEAGLIGSIGAWVLQAACAQLAAWQGAASGLEALTVSVNLSPSQLAEADIVATIEHALAVAGVRPTQLKLEITESAIVADPAAARNVLRALKALGVRLALDDFGTGYSSLSHLHAFPFDTLKIDKRFVADLASGRDAALVRTIVKLGEAMGMDVVAEGIETPAQRDVLRAMGCDFGQGYLFSKPLDVEAATRYLSPATT